MTDERRDALMRAGREAMALYLDAPAGPVLSSKAAPGYLESLVREAWFETLLVDLGLGPDERFGVFTIGLDEVVDMGAQLSHRGKGGASERLVGEN